MPVSACEPTLSVSLAVSLSTDYTHPANTHAHHTYTTTTLTQSLSSTKTTTHTTLTTTALAATPSLAAEHEPTTEDAQSMTEAENDRDKSGAARIGGIETHRRHFLGLGGLWESSQGGQSL
eukprot:261265-Rhodomonas_salina.2